MGVTSESALDAAKERRRIAREAAKERNRQAERLMVYRRLVACVARGERLSMAQRGELAEVMERLDLPNYALPRDARAVLEWNAVDLDARAMLALDHPHLFDNADEWAARWQSAKDRRRPAPAARATD